MHHWKDYIMKNATIRDYFKKHPGRPSKKNIHKKLAHLRHHAKTITATRTSETCHTTELGNATINKTTVVKTRQIDGGNDFEFAGKGTENDADNADLDLDMYQPVIYATKMTRTRSNKWTISTRKRKLTAYRNRVFDSAVENDHFHITAHGNDNDSEPKKICLMHKTIR